MLNSTQLIALRADILIHSELDAARLSGDDATLAVPAILSVEGFISPAEISGAR